MSDQLPTMDPPVHTDHRALLMRLITPKRLSENQEFMWRLCDRQLDSFLADGHGEYISGFASPVRSLVIADLLGVPEEDHPRFEEALLGGAHPRGAVAARPRTPWPTRRWSTCTNGSPSTSRIGAPAPVTTC